MKKTSSHPGTDQTADSSSQSLRDDCSGHFDQWTQIDLLRRKVQERRQHFEPDRSASDSDITDQRLSRPNLRRHSFGP